MKFIQKKSSLTKIRVSTGNIIHLLPYQQEDFTLPANKDVQFRLAESGNIAIFLMITEPVKILLKKRIATQYLVNVTKTPKDDPWIFVNALTGSLTEYELGIEA